MVEESIEMVKYWRDKGKTVLLDWDDSYETVTESNPAHMFWREALVTVHVGGKSYKKHIGYDPLEQFRYGLSLCSAGTVPSKVLADDYKNSGNVFYLRNYADANRYLDIPKMRKDHGDQIWIGTGGSLGHNASYRESGVNEALHQVLNNRDNVRIFMIGDERVKDILNLPPDKLIFRPYVPYFRWADILANYDISIAPLSGPFDRRRSFIKALEASISKIPFIATGDSQYPVYEEFCDCPSHIYVPSELTVPDYDERVQLWYDALTRMIDNIEHYKEQTEESFEIGMQYDADRNVDNIIGVYEEIINLGL